MGNKIGSAPSGQNSSPTGAEKLPATGSQYITLNTIKSWIQTAFNSAYSAFNHSHADSDNGGAVAHSVLTGAGTSIHLPAYSSDSTTFLSGTGEWLTPEGGLVSVYDSDVIFQDIVTGNASAAAHGFLPKLSGDSTNYLNGDGEWTTPAGLGSVYDSDIIFQAITTGNASVTYHGFLPALSGDSVTYLNGDGEWTAPPAGGTVYDSDVVFTDNTNNNASSDEHGYLPKLSGDSDNYLNGDGEWVTPASSGGGLLAVVSYNPATETTATNSTTTFADVDATNLTITFTVPASGNVVVKLEACCYNGSSGQYAMWNLRTTGGANVTGSKRDMTGSATIQRLTATIYISGLTPAASQTYRWGHARGSGGGSSNIRYGDDGSTSMQVGAASMEVWAAP